MSAIVARFADLRRADSKRPLIHLPAVGRAWSASDIWDAHLCYATRLTHAGIGPAQLVVSVAGNTAASVALLLACRALDLAIMPLDAATTQAEIRAIGTRFRAAALVLPPAMADAPPEQGEPAIPLADGLCLLLRAEPAPRRYAGTALLKLTSGSTGASKAALASDAQLIADGRQIVDAMEIRSADTQMAAIPLSHAYGLGVLVLPLLLQGTAFVLRDSFVPHRLPSDARAFGARIFPGVPYMFQYFIANPPVDGWPAGLARLTSAGAPLAAATVREFHARFGVKIHSFYGTTETGGIAFDGSDALDDGFTVGTPLPGVTVTLREDEDTPAGMGRVHVRSAAVAHGYLDEVAEGFDAGGFLTGDYGTIDDRGRLTLAGRLSSFVSVAGRKVQPDEVEQVLRAMPGVEDVRVLAAPDPQRGQQIVACLVAGAASPGVSALDVRRFAAARLAPHKVPRAVIFLDAIPLTARGKTDRPALDALVRARLHGEAAAL